MSIKVLLVDDEKEFTSILSERMKSRGLTVDIANTGPVAIKKVKEKSYDAIILDLAMPEMDGIEAMKHLLQENPDLQVIFLTGHATLEKGIEAVKLGAVEFMEKPVDINKLIDKVNEAKTKKTQLTDMRTEKNIKDILRKKGW
jgi:two-component system OmpR family response regulator